MYREIYKHGIPGYGQKGSVGVTGPDGSNILYSAITDSSTIIQKIRNNQPLSDNDRYTENETHYKFGDVILTTTGVMYEIEEGQDMEMVITEIGSFVNSDMTIKGAAVISELACEDISTPNPYKVNTDITYPAGTWTDSSISGRNISFTVDATEVEGVTYMKAFLEMGIGMHAGEKMIPLSGENYIESSIHGEIFVDDMWLTFKPQENEFQDTLIVEYADTNGKLYRISQKLNEE